MTDDTSAIDSKQRSAAHIVGISESFEFSENILGQHCPNVTQRVFLENPFQPDEC